MPCALRESGQLLKIFVLDLDPDTLRLGEQLTLDVIRHDAPFRLHGVFKKITVRSRRLGFVQFHSVIDAVQTGRRQAKNKESNDNQIFTRASSDVGESVCRPNCTMIIRSLNNHLRWRKLPLNRFFLEMFAERMVPFVL